MPRGKIVAVKLLWPGFARQPDQLQRFVRAMKTSEVLQHPNLVRIYGAGKANSCCWIAMEYVEGGSATRFIRQAGVAGRLDWRLGLRLAHHVAQALKFAHEHSIIHRNVTPNNVLLRTKDRVAKLGDLMLAKALEGDYAESISEPGDVLGDVPYLSPEQTRGTKDLDPRSDLYSLGATVYAVMGGRPPFTGKTLAEVTERIRNQPVTPLREAQSDPVKTHALSAFQRQHVTLQLEEIPAALEEIVLRTLAKRPDDRYQTATELVSDLEKVAAKNGVGL
jgi:serine/threonine-protein kinase